MNFDNTKIRRKNPIKRNNKFFSEKEFQLYTNIGAEYVSDILNQTVILYEVDYEKTNVDDIYQEAKKDEILFKTPVELNVIYNLNDPELKSYENSKALGNYVKLGRLEFGVYVKTLMEMDCDIKRGDYIGLQVTPEELVYFVVTDDGRINYSNSQTMFGYKPFYRNIKCSMIDNNEFNG